ncbi:MAG: DUF3108 domain-containing protein [Burkholderiales bacterium]
MKYPSPGVRARPLLVALTVSALAHALTLTGGGLRMPFNTPEPPPLQARLERLPEIPPVAVTPPPPLKPASVASPVKKQTVAAAPRRAISDTLSPFPFFPPAPEAPAESTEITQAEPPAVATEPIVIADAAPSTFMPERAAIKRLPRRGRIAYALYMGTNKFEVARTVQSWETSADGYKLESTSGTSGLASVFRNEQRVFRSTGRMTENGLQPESFVSSRSRRGQTDESVARFDWDKNSITLGRGEAQRSAALPAGSQDILSFMYQLSLAPPLPGRLQIAITNGSRFENYALDVLAEETLETPMGAIRALPVKQVRREGAESMEIWLAADYRYLPVRIRFIGRDGAATGEQVVTEINIGD